LLVRAADELRIPQKLRKLLEAKRLGPVAERICRVWMKVDQHGGGSGDQALTHHVKDVEQTVRTEVSSANCM
jgi:hypothetical protein